MKQPNRKLFGERGITVPEPDRRAQVLDDETVLAELRQLMTERLDITEIGSLWFDLFGTALDNDIPGHPLAARVIELLDRAKRHGKLEELARILTKSYPHVLAATTLDQHLEDEITVALVNRGQTARCPKCGETVPLNKLSSPVIEVNKNDLDLGAFRVREDDGGIMIETELTCRKCRNVFTELVNAVRIQLGQLLCDVCQRGNHMEFSLHLDPDQKVGVSHAHLLARCRWCKWLYPLLRATGTDKIVRNITFVPS
jgi:hypothetical protein